MHQACLRTVCDVFLSSDTSPVFPQHSGRFYEELPNTADYVSYRLACNKEDYPEPYSPPINPPLSFLPQQPYNSSQPATATSSCSTANSKSTFSPPSHTPEIFQYPSVPGLSSPPPGVAAYTFPKEQYVWINTLMGTRTSPVISYKTSRYKLKPFSRGGWKNVSHARTARQFLSAPSGVDTKVKGQRTMD